MTCKVIEHPSVAPGWGCCVCSTYNGAWRDMCKMCGHEPCGDVPDNLPQLREKWDELHEPMGATCDVLQENLNKQKAEAN